MRFEHYVFPPLYRITLVIAINLVSSYGIAQVSDSIQLKEAIVNGYLSHQPLVNTPASVSILNSQDLRQNIQSFLPALNSVPGLRMEERSPGSYRLSIRGSLLRSPFGVRNIKIYVDELPLTDASGNTYINLIDPSQIHRVEILKGPDGSLFGANSGGVVILNTQNTVQDSSNIQAGISGGSYGLFREHVTMSRSSSRVTWNFGEAFQRADGYRDQSFMKRLNLWGSSALRYGSQNRVRLFMIYSDLHYETPGGLTKAQFHDDPSQARPGTADQHTGVYNKTGFGGITNEIIFSPRLRHVLAVFGTITSFENPFITNYEVRNEKNTGARTYLECKFHKEGMEMKWFTGLEAQWGMQDISNYDNIAGQKGTLQSSDKIETQQAFYFTRIAIDLKTKLHFQAALSLNQYRYSFEGLPDKNFEVEWMPRVAASYNPVPAMAFRVTVSKGYSPPTIAEVRPSGSVINQNLQAEMGWNYEVGVRFSGWNDRLQLDGSVFRFELKDAITRQTDLNDVEYFLNAGSTNQTGVELMANAWLVAARSSGFVRGLMLKATATFNHFLFDDYQTTDGDYSGNRLTGVPAHVIVTGATINLPGRLTLFVQSNMVAEIPLNDANAEYASSYELLQARIGWKCLQKNQVEMELFTGADNILNQNYSLGNDINAFGGRYYNAAPLQNFYVGLYMKLN